MGVLNCCGSKNNEINNQMIFQTDFQSDLITNDEKQNNNYKKIEENFKNTIKDQAEFISDKSFEEALGENLEYLNNIDFPKEIENKKEEDNIILQPIKFSNNEIYKGSWNANKQRHGFGININTDGIIYKGLWDKDNIGNYGLFLYENGNYYKGELKQGKLDGKCEMEIKGKYKYVGDFSSDLPNGKGCLEDYENGFKYNGDMVNGVKEGKGILEYNDGVIYEGDFKNDLFNGFGVLKFKSGKQFEGEFVDGKIKGKGKFIWEDGKVYEGDYDNFMKNGFGKFSWSKDKYYEGQWLNNRQHGKGTLYYEGKEIEGLFRFGKIIKGN